jgi:hypothetical protein
MARLDDSPRMKRIAMTALLYHRHSPCANPGRRAMMNKPEAIGINHERNFKAGRPWLTD